MNPRDYWEQRLTRAPGLDGVGYAGLGRRYNWWLYRLRRHVFLREARRLGLDLATADVLDVGAGNGFYVELWHRLGAPTVTGSDFAPVAIVRLRERFPRDQFVLGDIADVDGDARTAMYDVISAVDVLFHIVDDDRYAVALRNIARMLRPGGHLVFSDAFLHRPAERAEHQVSRPLRDVEAMLAAAGLEVERRVPMFVLMNYPVDAPRALGLLWRVAMTPVRLMPPLGLAVGALLYPLERLLLALLPEGPSTELMICVKRTQPRTTAAAGSSPA